MNKEIKDERIISFVEEKEEFNETLKNQINFALSLKDVNKMVLLPDLHAGNYFPVGSVVSVEITEDANIYPAGIGFDINCGVRMTKTDLFYEEIEDSLSDLADKIFENISVGTPKDFYLRQKKDHKKYDEEFIKNAVNYETAPVFPIDLKLLDEILNYGVVALVNEGLVEDDLKRIENNGCLIGDSTLISQKAKTKGLTQLCSLGSGNHYIEIQRVDEIFCEESAKKIGITKNQIVYSIHTGSRGLGHQIKTEFPDSLKFNSEEGKKYFLSMNSAANFAWANRALICKKMKEILSETFNAKPELIYDVSHNIIKREMVDGKECLIHRKGASRAYGEEIPFELEGQPIPVGGSMGTSSYLLLGLKESKDISLSSCCHGSGRVLSRSECNKKYTVEDLKEQLKDVHVRFLVDKGLVEEIPSGYKDIDLVVKICEEKGIAKRIFKVKPLVVIKG